MRVDGSRILDVGDRSAVERPKDAPADAAGKPSQAVVVAPGAQAMRLVAATAVFVARCDSSSRATT